MFFVVQSKLYHNVRDSLLLFKGNQCSPLHICTYLHIDSISQVSQISHQVPIKRSTSIFLKNGWYLLPHGLDSLEPFLSQDQSSSLHIVQGLKAAQQHEGLSPTHVTLLQTLEKNEDELHNCLVNYVKTKANGEDEKLKKKLTRKVSWVIQIDRRC